jgi:hypothetical protein
MLPDLDRAERKREKSVRIGRASKAGTAIVSLLSATHEVRFLDEVT